MRIRVIACEVLFREISHAAALSPHQVDVEFLAKGLHDYGGAAMRKELQFRVDSTDPVKYDAVAMGYALCGNGLHGLRAGQLPLVAPRAHDCIALLMGGRERYEEFFNANPGTYFSSTGWLERGKSLVPLARVRTGIDVDLQTLIAKYGEDNGTYLFENPGGHFYVMAEDAIRLEVASSPLYGTVEVDSRWGCVYTQIRYEITPVKTATPAEK